MVVDNKEPKSWKTMSSNSILLEIIRLFIVAKSAFEYLYDTKANSDEEGCRENLTYSFPMIYVLEWIVISDFC